MKNVIYYNYNLSVEKIYRNKGRQYFFVDNTKIYIVYCKKEMEIINIFNLSNKLFQMGINVHTFIINNRGSPYTKYRNKYISLLKVNSFEETIDLYDLSKFWNIECGLTEYNILDEWKKIVDSNENRVIEFNAEFPLIQSSINYYIGFAEVAIQLLERYRKEISVNNNSIGHKVDYIDFKDLELYNPFIFIKTNKLYDICSYIKYKLLTNNIDYYEIDYILNNIIASEFEKIFFFSNLMYPSFYFSIIEMIIKEEKGDKILQNYLKYRDDYMRLLVYIKKNIENDLEEIRLLKWL